MIVQLRGLGKLLAAAFLFALERPVRSSDELELKKPVERSCSLQVSVNRVLVPREIRTTGELGAARDFAASEAPCFAGTFWAVAFAALDEVTRIDFLLGLHRWRGESMSILT